VVGSYGCAEHDAYIKALSNGGRLNRVFKKAGVAYGPRLKPGTEASTEDAKKRKADACVRPVGKRVKVPGKKNVESAMKPATALRHAVLSKTVTTSKTTTASKATSTPKTASTPKAAAAAKFAVAPKVAAVKTTSPCGIEGCH
jgi:hypothetical protein